MGMSTIPAGVLLTKEPDMLDALNIDTPYLSVKREYTLAGTAPGTWAGALAVLDYMGISGMKAVVAGCMKNTERLIAGMGTLGIEPPATPDVNVATFVCSSVRTLEGRVNGNGYLGSSACPTCSVTV